VTILGKKEDDLFKRLSARHQLELDNKKKENEKLEQEKKRKREEKMAKLKKKWQS
jgi:hypothetical protein